MDNAECTIFGLKDISMQIENADSRRKSTEKIGGDLREKKRNFTPIGVERNASAKVGESKKTLSNRHTVVFYSPRIEHVEINHYL